MATIFNVLQNKIKNSVDELLEYGFISNDRDSINSIKNIAKDIIDNSVSSHSMIDLLNAEPEILLMDLRNVPDTIKVMNSDKPNYLDSLKAFMTQALFNYALEYLHKKNVFKKDKEGNIVLKN